MLGAYRQITAMICKSDGKPPEESAFPGPETLAIIDVID